MARVNHNHYESLVEKLIVLVRASHKEPNQRLITKVVCPSVGERRYRGILMMSVSVSDHPRNTRQTTVLRIRHDRMRLLGGAPATGTAITASGTPISGCHLRWRIESTMHVAAGSAKYSRNKAEKTGISYEVIQLITFAPLKSLIAAVRRVIL